METIDNLVPDSEPTSDNIEALASEIPTSRERPLPDSATTNQAAITSLLSGNGERLIDTYQNIKLEASAGYSFTADRIKQEAVKRTREKVYQSGVLPVLFDPTIPNEEKQAVLDNFQNDESEPDSIVTLVVESLVEVS